MIASKVMCDDTYSNKSWRIAAQFMFSLPEINKMECEMCAFLEWRLNVDAKTLETFQSMIRNHFNCPGPYLVCILSTLVGSVGPSEATQQFASNTNPVSSCGPSNGKTCSPPPKSEQHQPHPPLLLLSPQDYTPGTPDSPSHSLSSLASSAPPTTPLGTEELAIQISLAGTSWPNFTIMVKPIAGAHPLKEKMFAHAVPTAW
jgi:hypothetical protein